MPKTSNERHNQLNQKEQPRYEWLPTVILKFLVFLAFAFVLFEATVGLGEHDLSSSRAWVVVAGMMGLLLLLGIDRLTTLKVTPTGVEATLAEAQAHALEEIGALDDPEVAQVARAQVLQADNPGQVQAAMAMAVELNVNRVLERVKEAIRAQRKCYVRYRPDPAEPVQTYHVAPLDVKPGKTAATQANDYLWAYSYEHQSIVSLRLDRVMGVEPSEETFDPAGLMVDWKESEWNVARDW
ncbi:MAG: WYL domain-containing protein [Chloroflexota bacterium]|nr:WYL domain-containing protein [Chloroflexota bacterium]